MVGEALRDWVQRDRRDHQGGSSDPTGHSRDEGCRPDVRGQGTHRIDERPVTCLPRWSGIRSHAVLDSAMSQPARVHVVSVCTETRVVRCDGRVSTMRRAVRAPAKGQRHIVVIPDANSAHSVNGSNRDHGSAASDDRVDLAHTSSRRWAPGAVHRRSDRRYRVSSVFGFHAARSFSAVAILSTTSNSNDRRSSDQSAVAASCRLIISAVAELTLRGRLSL